MPAAIAAVLVASLLAAAAASPADAGALPQEAALPELEDPCDAAGPEAESCTLSFRQLRGELRAVREHHRNASAACAENAKCAELGMSEGVCCPTADGTVLGCCDSAQTPVSTTPAPRAGTECSKFEACTVLGITDGACCPTPDGTMLGCCSATPAPPNATILKPKPNSECSRFDQCVASNLTQGYCCPTVTGHVLDCCGDLRPESPPAPAPEATAAPAPAPEAPAAVATPAPEAAPTPAPKPETSPCRNQMLASIGFVNCGWCYCVHYTTCPACR